jgi:hypothetical protein
VPVDDLAYALLARAGAKPQAVSVVRIMGRTRMSTYQVGEIVRPRSAGAKVRSPERACSQVYRRRSFALSFRA